MPFTLGGFAFTRPYLYHLTAPQIRSVGRQGAREVGLAPLALSQIMGHRWFGTQNG